MNKTEPEGNSNAVQWKDGGRYVTLELLSPFSFRETLLFLNRNDNEVLHVIKGQSVEKAVCLSGTERLLQVTQPDHAHLKVTFPLETPPAEARAAAARYVWDWLDLGTDLVPFYELAAHDPVLGPLTADYNGLRMIGIPDLFEALVWAVIGQQIHLHFAYTLKRRFVEHFGTVLHDGETSHYLFPRPDVVASLKPGDLLPLQFSARKAEYVIGIAGLAADGSLSKESLAAAGGFEAMRKELTSIRGVGAWTADYAIMKSMKHSRAFPVADVGLHNALKNRLGLAAKPTVPEIVAMAENWAGWEAYAVFYLWRSLLC